MCENTRWSVDDVAGDDQDGATVQRMNVARGAPESEVPLMAQSSNERCYYSVSEAASLLGVSRDTVWRWVRAGRLPIHTLGPRMSRVKRTDLERLLADRHAGRGR